MDQKTTIEDLKKKVQSFCETRDWDQYHNAKDLAIGIITEASELLEHFRFKNEAEIEKFFHDPKKKGEIESELADILWFLVRIAQRYDIDLSKTLNAKIALNEKRYPVEKVKGKSVKYTEL